MGASLFTFVRNWYEIRAMFVKVHANFVQSSHVEMRWDF